MYMSNFRPLNYFTIIIIIEATTEEAEKTVAPHRTRKIVAELSPSVIYCVPHHFLHSYVSDSATYFWMCFLWMSKKLFLLEMLVTSILSELQRNETSSIYYDTLL
ncbi:hypothetical protein VNO77_16996 [Canavalia gladiata]|uniref:Uncharacterized protein n=1 Tax=Canavalia gladiata TaxID=3824 RepID=A0AAN9QIB7_CANGL